VDIALMELYFSRLGTGPTWLCLRFAPNHEISLHRHNIDRIEQQLLQQHAVEIAKGYQDQARWSLAAQNLRAPYWDWATNIVPPPEVISLEYLDIIKPEGKKSVPNPLLRYKFKPVDPSFELLSRATGIAYKDWQTTIRHPRDQDLSNPDAKTNVQLLTSYGFTFPDQASLSFVYFFQ
jgi:Common central domain of tyrosinase